MWVKARTSFGGVVSMTQGQVKDLPVDAVLKDLLQAGYVEEAAERAVETVEEAVEERTAEERAVERAVAERAAEKRRREELEKKRKEELVEMAAELGLSIEGLKAELAARIAKAECDAT